MIEFHVGHLEMIGVVLAMIGQLFVARRNVKGFYVWIFSNVALMAFAAANVHWWMVALYAFFLCSSIYSIWYWQKAPTSNPA